MKQIIRHKPSALRRNIKNQMKTLRRQCVGMLSSGERSATGEWLRDNFYLLEHTGRTVLTRLKYCAELPEERKLPRAYNLACDMVERICEVADPDAMTSGAGTVKSTISSAIG